MTKTYTIESSNINCTGGRYKSNSPMSAGRKAASKLFKKAHKNAKYKSLKKITFCIRETTKGSERKFFDYQATRIKLAKPLVRVINGVEIINRYKTIVKAVVHKKASAMKKASMMKKASAMKKTKGGDCGCNK